MIYFKEFKGYEGEVVGKRKKVDNTIYTFDIETTSFIILDGKQLDGIKYQDLNKDEQDRAEFKSTMYIWQFGINDTVYYGRSWSDFIEFLNVLEKSNNNKKIIFVHNLAFEFQYLKTVLDFEEVVARVSRKVMKATLLNYNIEFRCTLILSNQSLKSLGENYELNHEKKDGDLDYSKFRHSLTPLTEKELVYCEYDCLVVYDYILKELQEYERVDNIPLTSTGHVRRELKELVQTDYEYKRKVRKAINTDPHIYNLLIQAFMGGYTHANWLYTDEVLENVDSYDFTSSYPYVMVSHKYPSSEFRKCYLDKAEDMISSFAYLLVVRFNNIESKYFNNIISFSKCRNIYGGKFDNGRVIGATSLELTLTDVDFKLILEAYNIESYEILESYYSNYNYLPKQFINFILDKYVIKTQYKNVDDKKDVYNREKAKFNALYGMSVTNTIRADVKYNNDSKEWVEIPLTNEEIEKKLKSDKAKAFLSFAYGVWVTAYARNNLLKNLLALDDKVIYSDTDSLKLVSGYDKKVIKHYNEFVEKKLKFVSKNLGIPFAKFSPKDIYGEDHMLGLFENETKKGRKYTYDKFITQGAKKYCYEVDGKISITVAGVPKNGARALNSIDEFRDNLVFRFKDTNKNLLMYVENQEPLEVVDFLGNKYKIDDKSGCCLVPTTYVLGKALEYCELLTDNSSERAIYNETSTL